MSCACVNRLLAMERERVYRLAKGWAAMEGREAVMWRNADGTYGFGPADNGSDMEIIEYITPY